VAAGKGGSSPRARGSLRQEVAVRKEEAPDFAFSSKSPIRPAEGPSGHPRDKAALSLLTLLRPLGLALLDRYECAEKAAEAAWPVKRCPRQRSSSGFHKTRFLKHCLDAISKVVKRHTHPTNAIPRVVNMARQRRRAGAFIPYGPAVVEEGAVPVQPGGDCCRCGCETSAREGRHLHLTEEK
jgi:hypothetical protein